MTVPPVQEDPPVVPRHIAVIMDGNGRWAKQKRLPRIAGHRKGVEVVRSMVPICGKRGIPYLTLFAFSSENWQRPGAEVKMLIELLTSTLENEILELHELQRDVHFQKKASVLLTYYLKTTSL